MVPRNRTVETSTNQLATPESSSVFGCLLTPDDTGDARDPDTVVQLLRSGELELLSEELPPKGYEGNILGG